MHRFCERVGGGWSDTVNVFKDISQRTNGDIYLGVVGAVRTGKSTFIKKFMELVVLPNIENESERERALDELPQSAAGKTIMTTEPKFVPNQAVEVNVEEGLHVNVRLVDCVGYAIDRKSTRLNSSHVAISYAVFCLKKKKGMLMSLRQHLVSDWSHSGVLNRYVIGHNPLLK